VTVLAETLTSTLTLSPDVDLDGDVEVDSTLDLAPRPSGDATAVRREMIRHGGSRRGRRWAQRRTATSRSTIAVKVKVAVNRA
jgi:hypothetical protein